MPQARPALFRQSAEHMCRISDPSLRRLYMTRCGYIDVGFRTLLQHILQGRLAQVVAFLSLIVKAPAHPGQRTWAW